VLTQAALVGLNRSSLDYQLRPPSAQELALKHRIDERYPAHPLYGSRKLAAVLQDDFGPIHRQRVQRSMRAMGSAGSTPGPNLSRRVAQQRIDPYLLRGVTAAAPNHIWGRDITYVRLRQGWLYLVVVLDWFSRYVLSWAVDDTLALPFVLDAVGAALQRATPQIWNSDQGSQFTSPQLTQLLEATGAQISMDGRGRAHDTIVTERFWRSLKDAEVERTDYASPREARLGIGRYIDFYNVERPHQALGYARPAER